MELEEGLSVGDSEEGDSEFFGVVVHKGFNIQTDSAGTFIYYIIKKFPFIYPK
jgi:hypothetical protein